MGLTKMVNPYFFIYPTVTFKQPIPTKTDNWCVFYLINLLVSIKTLFTNVYIYLTLLYSIFYIPLQRL